VLIGSGIILLSDNKQLNIGKEQEVFYPEPTNYIVDTFGFLEASTTDYMNNDLQNFDPTAQIAVAVVKTTKPLSIEEYGIRLAEKWKVGHQDIDNGIIIILATEDRKVRIEVGKGLEGELPDAVVGRIIDENMVPSLKKDEWASAVFGGVYAIKSKLINYRK
jgi:uncharacterized protein